MTVTRSVRRQSSCAKSDRSLIAVRHRRIAVALHVGRGQAERDRLDARHRHGKHARNRRQRLENVAAAEVQRQRLLLVIDVVEVEPRLELMLAGEQADRVEHLIAIVQTRLRREPLPADARDSEHFERRPALGPRASHSPPHSGSSESTF